MNKTLVFIDDGFLSKLSKHFGNGKHYKSRNLDNISSLWTVTIFPGDLRVAGCFSFIGGLK